MSESDETELDEGGVTSESPAPKTATESRPESAPSARPEPMEPSAETDDEDDDFGDRDDEDDHEDDEEPSRSYERSYSRGAEGRANRKSGGFESLLRDSFRKAVERGLEVGIGTLKSADHVVRNVADEVKMPKEISNYLFSQIDETKNVLIRAVAGEVREFLDQTDLATEMQRALTALSFEIKMEIRFIPNDAGELKPKVKARAVPRARRQDPKNKPDEG